tara:strand:- start:666 stop:1043 length:378 start_codon:yes stop_codon:yes gene_type:complete
MPSFTFIAPSGKSSKEIQLSEINSKAELAAICSEVLDRDKPAPKQQQASKRRLWVTLPNGRRASVLTRKNYRYAVAASAPHCERAAAWFLEGERVKAQRRANYYTKRPNTGGQFVVLTVDEGEGV